MEVKVSKECDRASPQGKTAAITGLRSRCVFDNCPQNALSRPYLQRWVLFERVPVLGVVAVGVSHGVRVLAEDDRPGFVALLRNADNLIDARVHWTDDVCRTRAAASAFVLDRPRIVALADKAGHGEVR
jgi:hypothetical protein